MTSGYAVEDWESFAVAQVGAAAALAGLIVVAASINIERIIRLPVILKRLGATLAQFTGILAVSSLLLVPGQDHRLLGIEIAIVGTGIAALMYFQHSLRAAERPYRGAAIIAVTSGILAALMIAVGGVGYATTSIGGLYWMVPGVLIGFGIGLVNAWVALVEILR